MKINGLPVVDPHYSVILHIKDQDINRGKSKDPAACAAARACVREIPACSQARVHLGRVYIIMKKKVLRLQTPKPLRSEIIAFDRGGKFYPGTYTLSPVHHPLGKGTGSSKGRNNPKDKQKKRRPYHIVKGVRPFGANK